MRKLSNIRVNIWRMFRSLSAVPSIEGNTYDGAFLPFSSRCVSGHRSLSLGTRNASKGAGQAVARPPSLNAS